MAILFLRRTWHSETLLFSLPFSAQTVGSGSPFPTRSLSLPAARSGCSPPPSPPSGATSGRQNATEGREPYGTNLSPADWRENALETTGNIANNTEVAQRNARLTGQLMGAQVWRKPHLRLEFEPHRDLSVFYRPRTFPFCTQGAAPGITVFWRGKEGGRRLPEFLYLRNYSAVMVGRLNEEGHQLSSWAHRAWDTEFLRSPQACGCYRVCPLSSYCCSQLRGRGCDSGQRMEMLWVSWLLWITSDAHKSGRVWHRRSRLEAAAAHASCSPCRLRGHRSPTCRETATPVPPLSLLFLPKLRGARAREKDRNIHSSAAFEGVATKENSQLSEVLTYNLWFPDFISGYTPPPFSPSLTRWPCFKTFYFQLKWKMLTY